MKFSIPYADAAFLLSLLLAPLPAASMLACDHIVSDGQQYNLKALGGPHSVVTSRVDGNRIHNTTYTVDICAPLKKKGDDQCPNYTRVCAIKRLIKPGETLDTIEEVTPLAGELAMLGGGGGPLDPEVSRLSKADPELGKEGLRVLLKGGFGYTDTNVKRKKNTVIDFVCNKDLDGTEGEYDSEDKYEHNDDPVETRADEDGDKGDNGDENKDKDGSAPPKEVQLGIEHNPSLVFDSYGPSDSNADVDVLHLTWSSKYVCDSKSDDGSGGDNDDSGAGKPSSHWGVFTWIVIL
ncbi:autophagy-related protein 27 [Xylaria intraflava]|nr:autophagy-related protein 27 [Xylaria intraflava]